VDWLEPEEGDEWTPEEWEHAKRSVAELMDEQYGPDWRTWPREGQMRAYEELTASLPGQIAKAEQEVAFGQEVVAFETVLLEKLDAAAAAAGLEMPLPPSVWGPVLTEAVHERYGGFTTLALDVCRQIGYEPIGHEPKEDRVFEG
jgi:hypothetical protein